MKPLTEQHFFSFDGESLGLHGPTFAWAVALALGGRILEEKACHLPLNKAIDLFPKIYPDDEAWVRNNVSIPSNSKEVESMEQLRDEFWTYWVDCKKRFPDLLLLAEVPWPVETSFLSYCVARNPGVRGINAPYPIVDVANLLIGARLNPLDVIPRLDNETPAHNPLCDARQSLRVGVECLKKAGW